MLLVCKNTVEMQFVKVNHVNFQSGCIYLQVLVSFGFDSYNTPI